MNIYEHDKQVAKITFALTRLDNAQSDLSNMIEAVAHPKENTFLFKGKAERMKEIEDQEQHIKILQSDYYAEVCKLQSLAHQDIVNVNELKADSQIQRNFEAISEDGLKQQYDTLSKKEKL